MAERHVISPRISTTARTLLQQAQGRKAHLQDAGAFILGLDANLAFA